MKAFIGGGNMAEAMIKGLITAGGRGAKGDIIVSDPSAERRSHLESSYGVSVTDDNLEAVREADIVVLAVKPQRMAGVLEEIAEAVGEHKTVVSIAAGITLAYLKKHLKSKQIVRAMPNTPALVGEGMTVLSLCDCFPDRDIAPVREIFMSIGRVMVLPESKMDAVTAVSGSGPAFVALFVEAVVEAGEQSGLSAQEASELAVQTLAGTARLLDSGMSPSELKKMVTSPGGTTAEGLKVFEARGLRGMVSEALTAAVRKSKELGKT